MSNFTKFSAWLENRISEDAAPQASGTATPPDPNVSKLSAMAARQYNINIPQVSKDPKALKMAQDKVLSDPKYGPKIAASMFGHLPIPNNMMR